MGLDVVRDRVRELHHLVLGPCSLIVGAWGAELSFEEAQVRFHDMKGAKCRPFLVADTAPRPGAPKGHHVGLADRKEPRLGSSRKVHGDVAS